MSTTKFLAFPFQSSKKVLNTLNNKTEYSSFWNAVYYLGPYIFDRSKQNTVHSGSFLVHFEQVND